jgi:predicted polyphosphate/ATP-dependent NAD kinase
MRNIEMVDKLKKHKHGVVVAFPGGRGTAHTVAYARGAGVPVVSISADDWPQGRIP